MSLGGYRYEKLLRGYLLDEHDNRERFLLILSLILEVEKPHIVSACCSLHRRPRQDLPDPYLHQGYVIVC